MIAAQPKTDGTGAGADDRPAPYRPLVEEKGDLRPKNQLTVPRRVAEAMRLEPGDRLIFVVDEEGSSYARLYRMPKSLAGIAPDAYGGRGDAKGYLQAERATWND